MHCATTRFGDVAYEEGDVLHLPEGLAPFRDARRFVLLSDREQWPFVWLQCLDVPSLAFVALPLEEWFPREAALACEAWHRVGGTSLLRAYGLVVVGRQGMTVNVLAPVVVDFGRMQGRQVVLDGPVSDARRPLRSEPETASVAH
jgi:flagellar assembly factor FliW